MEAVVVMLTTMVLATVVVAFGKGKAFEESTSTGERNGKKAKKRKIKKKNQKKSLK